MPSSSPGVGLRATTTSGRSKVSDSTAAATVQAVDTDTGRLEVSHIQKAYGKRQVVRTCR